MSTEVLEAPVNPLTHWDKKPGVDRCDRCGAEAYMKASKRVRRKVLSVLFCAHHGRHHMEALANGKWTVLDYSDTINAKPTDPSLDDI